MLDYLFLLFTILHYLTHHDKFFSRDDKFCLINVHLFRCVHRTLNIFARREYLCNFKQGNIRLHHRLVDIYAYLSRNTSFMQIKLHKL